MTSEKQRDAHFEFSESENSKFIFYGPAWRTAIDEAHLYGWLLVQLVRARIKRTFRNLKNRFLL